MKHINRLKHIAEAVDESRYIYKLESGWDGMNADNITHVVWSLSIQMILKYSKSILESKNIVIDEPDINPCPNGSIDLSWRSQEYALLINISKNSSKYVCSYYGKSYETDEDIKNINDPLDIDKELEFWISKFDMSNYE